MKRWTIKELKEKSDAEVIISIISDCLIGLNPYALTIRNNTKLAKRLRKIRNDMESRLRMIK